MQNACIVQRQLQSTATITKNQSNLATKLIHHSFTQVSNKLVLYASFKWHTRSIRRTLYANALNSNVKIKVEDFAELHTPKSQNHSAEYVLDTSTLSASTITVSRSLALSFQSAFQLSFTVLVCYRSRSRI